MTARWPPPGRPASLWYQTSIGPPTRGWSRPTSWRLPKTTRPAWERARSWGAAVAFVAVLAVSLWRRLAMLHRPSFDWDEGVYWQSLESMRHGHRLFGEVFSSQPPLLLGGLY